MPTLLLIDDDVRLGALITDYLTGFGFQVQTESDASRAVELVQGTTPDIVLLDIGLGTHDGLEICRGLRSHYRGILCMFSASTDDTDHALGLELGADDYITKPVPPRLLLARLRAHLRRQTLPPPEAVAVAEGLTLDPATRVVQMHGQSVSLTTAEFDLLALLSRHTGKILDRQTLLLATRGLPFDGVNRSIDACISRLRQKLGDDPDDPQLIKTVRGKGYLLCARLAC